MNRESSKQARMLRWRDGIGRIHEWDLELQSYGSQPSRVVQTAGAMDEKGKGRVLVGLTGRSKRLES